MESPKASESMLRKNRLLEQLRNKELDMKGFLKECAYWVLESLDEYKPIQHPAFPQQLKDYIQMSDSQKNRIPTTLWHESEIFNFLENRQAVFFQNRSNFIRLYKWLRNIPLEDKDNRRKIIEKIGQYKTFFSLNSCKFYRFEYHQEEKTIDFPEDIDQQTQDALETFNGEVQ